MATVTISFTVDSEGDKDLVRWLDSLPRRKRSAPIRKTLRDGLARGGVTLGDVYQAVKGLRQLGIIKTVVRPDQLASIIRSNFKPFERPFDLTGNSFRSNIIVQNLSEVPDTHRPAIFQVSYRQGIIHPSH